MSSISFGMNVFEESPELILGCLTRIRAAYPDSPIFIICDGGSKFPEEYPLLAKQQNADYAWDSNLKVSGGALWWKRFFETAIKYDTDFTFKIDADTRIHRPFKFFPEADLFGSMDKTHVQGGIQGFSRHAVKTILESKECEDPRYGKPPFLYKAKGILQFTTDHSIIAIIKKLGLTPANWTEVHSEWLRLSKNPGDVAASHPHPTP